MIGRTWLSLCSLELCFCFSCSWRNEHHYISYLIRQLQMSRVLSLPPEVPVIILSLDPLSMKASSYHTRLDIRRKQIFFVAHDWTFKDSLYDEEFIIHENEFTSTTSPYKEPEERSTETTTTTTVSTSTSTVMSTALDKNNEDCPVRDTAEWSQKMEPIYKLSTDKFLQRGYEFRQAWSNFKKQFIFQ